MFYPVEHLTLNYCPPSAHEADSDLCTSSFYVSFPKGKSPERWPAERSTLRSSATLKELGAITPLSSSTSPSGLCLSSALVSLGSYRPTRLAEPAFNLQPIALGERTRLSGIY